MREGLGWLAAALLAIIALFVLSPEFSHFASGLAKPLTEGNTAPKQVLLFAFLLYCTLLKIASLKLNLTLPKQITREILIYSFVFLVVFGFLLNIGANLLLFSKFGASANEYVAHVTDCGKSVCWEASYLQHSHSLKPAIYFIEKNTGLSFGSATDTGRPIYEIMPYADPIASITVLVLLSIFIASSLLVMVEKKLSSFLLLSLAAVLSIISVLDGGPWTVAGINAAVLVALYFANEKSFSKSPALILSLLAYIFIIGFELPKWLGTNLVFRDWFAPSSLLVGFYLLYKFSHGRFLGWKGVALLLLLYSGYCYLDYFDFVYNGDAVGPGMKAVIYGFPVGENASLLLSNFNEPKLNSFTSYGWYAILEPSQTIRLNDLLARLKVQIKPPGYFLGEADIQKSPVKGSVSVFMDSGKRAEIRTVSFNPTGDATCPGKCTIEGYAGIYSTHLALEIGSYLHSQGIDAVVITPAMWKYG